VFITELCLPFYLVIPGRLERPNQQNGSRHSNPISLKAGSKTKQKKKQQKTEGGGKGGGDWIEWQIPVLLVGPFRVAPGSTNKKQTKFSNEHKKRRLYHSPLFIFNLRIA